MTELLIMKDEQACYKRARRAHRATRICEYTFFAAAALFLAGGLISHLGVVDFNASGVSVPMCVLCASLGLVTKAWTDMLDERDFEREMAALRESRRHQALDRPSVGSEPQHLEPEPCDCATEIVIGVSDDSPLLELLGIVPSEVSELEGGELTLTDEQLAKLGVSITVEEVCSRCCS